MRINYIYRLLAITLVFLVILIPLFRIDGGLVDDDYYYIEIAESLPNFNISVFPIGYPLVLRFVNLIFNDYFISSRFIAACSFILILLFSYFKKFYFKETVLLMSFKFFTIFFYGLSETLFIPVFYLLFYFLYEIVVNEKNRFFLLGICIFILVMIRYSGLFIWGGIFTYTFFSYLFNKGKKNEIAILSLTKALVISLLLIISFLFINVYYTDAFFGENVREGSLLQNTNGLQFLVKSILFPFYVAINPISEIFRLSLFSFILTLLSSTIFSSIILFLFFKNINKQNKNLFVLSVVMMSIYFIGLLYSSYKTGIEAMHFRLNSPIVFILFFITIISVKDKIGKKILLIIAFVSISINSFFNLNKSFNYIEKRANVIHFYLKRDSPKYYFNDINIIPTETGGVLTSNFFTLYCINPKIKKMENIKNIDKSNIVFESQLVNVKPVNSTHYSNSFSISK